MVVNWTKAAGPLSAAVLQVVVDMRPRPMQWSPCSSYLSMLQHDACLLVMNTGLDILYIWDPESSDSWCGYKPIPLWGPSSTFMAAMRSQDPAGHPYELELLWHAASIDPISAEAGLVRDFLAGLGSGNHVQCLVWGPVGGLAAATVSFPRDADGKWLGRVAKLVVMLADGSLASMTVQDPDDNFTHSWWPIVWSPAGDRLLLNRDSRPELVSSACVAVLQMELVYGARAVFSPDGRYVAGVCRGPPNASSDSLKLWSASSGAVVFCEAWEGLPKVDLTFAGLGDLLLLPGKHAFQVVQFGCNSSTTDRNKQLCKAVPAACSWLDRTFKREYDSEYEY